MEPRPASWDGTAPEVDKAVEGIAKNVTANKQEAEACAKEDDNIDTGDEKLTLLLQMCTRSWH